MACCKFSFNILPSISNFYELLMFGFHTGRSTVLLGGHSIRRLVWGSLRSCLLLAHLMGRYGLYCITHWLLMATWNFLTAWLTVLDLGKSDLCCWSGLLIYITPITSLYILILLSLILVPDCFDRTTSGTCVAMPGWVNSLTGQVTELHRKIFLTI